MNVYVVTSRMLQQSLRTLAWLDGLFIISISFILNCKEGQTTKSAVQVGVNNSEAAVKSHSIREILLPVHSF